MTGYELFTSHKDERNKHYESRHVIVVAHPRLKASYRTIPLAFDNEVDPPHFYFFCSKWRSESNSGYIWIFKK